MEKYNKATHEFFGSLTKQAESPLDEEMHPIELKNYLVDNYKTDWLEWVPEVVDLTILAGKNNEYISNKIQAIRICQTTDTPWDEWHVFEKVGKSFNHQIPDFGIMQPLSLGECLTTMHVMTLLRPEENFSEEVLSYIGSVAANENYVYLPEEMLVGKAQHILDNFIYDHDLKMKTKAAWGKVKGKDILDVEFKEDNSLHRQLSKLALVQEYFREYNG